MLQRFYALYAWSIELIKAFSDFLLGFILRSTSWFGRELTEEGKTEQRMWREQRLRNNRGLGLVSRRRRTRTEGE